jgi:Ca-activated chloride channel family protein
MNREQAEKLLAALIFDDLDDASKAELQAYLQTDDELRDRLADMRMAAKLACDAVKEDPDPVLSEDRLKQLKQLAKPAGTKGRIFTMRRFLAAAAVLVFGSVLIGLLVPSLSRVRHYQSTTYPQPAMEQRLSEEVARSQNAPSGQPGTDMDRLIANSRRVSGRTTGVAPDAGANRDATMGGMGGMGAYGGGMMGGYGGTYSTATGNRAPAATDHDVDMSSGSSLGVSRRVASGQPAAPSLGTELMTGRTRGSSMPLSIIRGEQMELKESAFEANGRSDSAQPSSGAVSLDSSVASAKRPADAIDDAEARRELVRIESAEAGDKGRYYSRSGAVTPRKPAEPMTTPAPPDSAWGFDGKQNTTVGTAGSVDADRVPILGDKPIVGGLFRKSESEVKKDLSDGSDLRAWAQGPSYAPSVRLNRGEANREPADRVGVVLNMQDAGDAYSKDITYPKNWGEIASGQKADAVLEMEEAGVPLVSHFRVVPVNPWVLTDRDRLSTFALDVDTASYALCRRYIRRGFLPPIGAVRMEEFINAFDYAYPQRDDATFAVYAEGAPSPFAGEGQDLALLKIAVKARTVGRDQRRAAHLVFVVDASASMGQVDRLPAVQAALNLLVDKLSDVDRVSLITCSNDARLHLEAVPAQQKDAIRQAIDSIQPAGPTNLMAGLRLGYAMARKAFVAARINQVVLCSDGVANVGQTEAQAVLGEVAGDRKQGITLTCVGVGYGAYNDAFLEALADQGDGRYVFLDSSEEARDALVGQLAATLQTVAKDARIQVEFNPARVRRYRLIGYENRDIEDQRFRDDTIDAGEVGSGQCSTALYELELTAPTSADGDNSLGTVFVRYRQAETGQIEEISRPLAGSLIRRRSVEQDPRFFLAAGAARFAEWLRQSEHAQHTALADVQRLLDNVSAALPLDRDVQDLAGLAHQAEHLPRASPTVPQPGQ